MPRSLLLAAIVTLHACDPVDGEGQACDPQVDYCGDISIVVVDDYGEYGAPLQHVLALGGLLELRVDEVEPLDGEMTVELSGADLVSQTDRGLVLRAVGLPGPPGELVRVDAEIDGNRDYLVLAARPVDRVEMRPMEKQFLLADGPVEFGLARGAMVVTLIQLFGGEDRLIDGSLEVTTGPGVFEQLRWDLVMLQGGAEPAAFSIAADTTAVDVEIAVVEPDIDTIEVMSGPGLADPEQPIQLSAEGDATVCFQGVADGLPLAGLAWSIEGDHLTADDGCAFLDPEASTLTVSANGLSRTFELEIEDP